jgi:hypothetical protein
LLVLVLLRMCGVDSDTANRELTTLRIGRRLWVRTLAISPVVVVVAVVIARGRRTRSGRDGLFELLNLMGEESSTEGAGHCELVRGRASSLGHVVVVVGSKANVARVTLQLNT